MDSFLDRPNIFKVRKILPTDLANLYGVIAAHDAITCPSSNKAARESSKKLLQQMPRLFQKYKLKMLSGEHFDPEHLTIIRVEADNIEAVRDFVNEAGLVQWNNVRIYPLTPIDKLIEMVDKLFPNTLY
jgi:hypothetical protein